MIDLSGIPVFPCPRQPGGFSSSPFRLLLSLLLAFLPLGTGQAQFEYYGLRGNGVHSVAQWSGKLYAATDNGVYVQARGGSDTNWTLVGLKGRSVQAVYPHPFGAIGYAVTAGVRRTPGSTDSTVLFCSRNSDSAWVAADTGISHNEVSSIRSIHGFFSPAICGETYAGGNGKVFMRAGDMWQEVFDIGIGVVNVVRANEANATVWVGGETAIFAPYIAHSHDKGKTWVTTFPNLAGDNACDALTFDPSDTTVVYAGMEGAVIKSTDGGHQWFQTGLTGTPFYIYGLVFDNLTHTLFAGGTTSNRIPGLYASKDEGEHWMTVPLPATIDGILSMTLVPTAIPEQNLVIMGTLSSGVVAYRIPFTAVHCEPLPGEYHLSQNYPNPFNSTSDIRYHLPALTISERQAGISEFRYVRLAVYDLLGREIAVLVDEKQSPGSHQVRFDAKGADPPHGSSDGWRGSASGGGASALASGVYVYRLVAGDFIQTRKLLLLR